MRRNSAMSWVVSVRTRRAYRSTVHPELFALAARLPARRYALGFRSRGEVACYMSGIGCPAWLGFAPRYDAQDGPCPQHDLVDS